MSRAFWILSLAVGTLGSAGPVRFPQEDHSPLARPSALEPSKEDLLALYNQQAHAVSSLNAEVSLVPAPGPSYGGADAPYPEIGGVLMAQRPARIRLIGRAPVLETTIFDLVSDGRVFRLLLPTAGTLIVGVGDPEYSASNPLENLRPQQLLDVLFWPEITGSASVLLDRLEEPSGQSYILTLVRESRASPQVARRVWFDRTHLSVTRLQLYAPGERLVSDIRYADWKPVSGQMRYPLHVWLARPGEDYQLEVRIRRLGVNQPMSDEQFRLVEPPGTKIVILGADGKEPAQRVKQPWRR